MSKKFSIFFLTNGRYGYLQRTVASWQTNLESEPQHRIIFDDSGDEEYFKKLKLEYAKDFEVVQIRNNTNGQPGALKFIFRYLKSKRSDYFLMVEEDWILFRQTKVEEMIDVLEKNKHIVQMRLPRAGVETAGSTLKRLLDAEKALWSKHKNWFEWQGPRYFWTHNPNIFPRHILAEEYPQAPGIPHELEFGLNLLKKYPNARSAFWANNIYDAYVLHIGFRNDELLKRLEMNKIDYKIGVKFGGK